MKFEELEKLVTEMRKDENRFNLTIQGLTAVYLLAILNQLKDVALKLAKLEIDKGEDR